MFDLKKASYLFHTEKKREEGCMSQESLILSALLEILLLVCMPLKKITKLKI